MSKFRPRKQMRPQKQTRPLFLVVASIAAVLGVLFGFMFWLYLDRPSPNYSASSDVDVKASVALNVEELVGLGDDAFSAYRYDDALANYRKAEDKLASIIRFENNSPSRNVNYLQHCHNAQTLLEARIKLALIADDISRLEQSPPDDFPSTANEPTQ